MQAVWFGRCAGIGAAAAALLLTACGASEQSPIIGVPAAAPAPANTPPADNAQAVQEALLTQLDDALAAPVAKDNSAAVLSEINALTNDGTLILAERIQKLQALGAKLASSREAVLQGLIGQVESNNILGQVSVAGTNVQQGLLAILRSDLSQLEGLGAEIAGSDLIDVIRSDVVELATQVKTYALVDPMAHITIAAGDVLAQAVHFQSLVAQLSAQAQSGAGSDPNFSAEEGALQQAGSDLNAVVATADAAVQRVEALTPSTPNFQAVLAQERNAISAAVGPNGSMTVATQQIQQAQYLLGLR